MQIVSVVIPTKDRPAQLERFLQSISKAGEKYYELIVIDSSVNKKSRIMNKQNTVKIGGRHFFFNAQGNSKARNKGIKESKGNLILFSDDDFIAQKGWINNMVLNFDDPEVSCVTGRMISYRHDEASCLYEKAMSFDRGSRKRVFSRKDLRVRNLFSTITKIGQKRLFETTPVPWAVGYGYCAFRKDVFREVGFYDENLGRGTKSCGGEDIDMFYRLLRTNHKIVYDPNATVFHDHRKGLENVFKDARQSGIAIRAFIRKYWRAQADFYMLSIFFGYIFLVFFSGTKATLRREHDLKDMIKTELASFLL